MKLNASNSFGSEEMRIANTPVDGVLSVQFSGKAAVVDLPVDAAGALKAEQEGRERIKNLINNISKLPSADEMQEIIKKYKQ
ncbi:MAG: hypothetical protein PSV16_00655 [Flavobacterium sp.]|nr:hypothetical protein [Flavobacterium sp.]